MNAWTKFHVYSKNPETNKNNLDAMIEYKCCMERLIRDLRLYKISTKDLIDVIAPTKTIKPEMILDALKIQANQTGSRRDTLLEAYQVCT